MVTYQQSHVVQPNISTPNIPAICNNMDEPGGQYTKRNKPDTERKNCMISLICGI